MQTKPIGIQFEPITVLTKFCMANQEKQATEMQETAISATLAGEPARRVDYYYVTYQHQLLRASSTCNYFLH